MTDTSRPLRDRARRWIVENPVAAIITFTCLAIEAVLQGADQGLWGAQDWRDVAFTDGAFWAPLLHGTQPIFATQPEAMFLTYGFLHAGLLHVGVNMASMVSLAVPISARLGQRRFALLYFIALLGGGAGFGLLSSLQAPMIGASGALFGLVGAILAWAWADRRAYGQHPVQIMRALARPFIILIGLNVVMFWGTGGQLAWQTHLGGFVTGWIAGLLLDPRALRRR